MRRSALVFLALTPIVQLPAAAQTCMGFASFGPAPLQATASGSLNNLSNTFGATIGYGTLSGVYGNFGVATTGYDELEGSTLGLAAHAGYQIGLGASRSVQICPNVGFGIGRGPNDDAAGNDQFGQSATIGFSIGTELGGNPRMSVVPTAGFFYAYSSQKAENSAGAELFEISDQYWMTRIGIGFILSQRISVRPSMDISVDRLETSHPTFSLTLGYNFGR
jgi:hypothetical protein